MSPPPHLAIRELSCVKMYTGNLRQSKIKCSERKRFIFQCPTYAKLKTCVPVCPVCGKPTALISNYQRIIGGKEAPQHTIPWQVMLSVGGNRAGGMVISDRWILTAAHVLDKNGAKAEVDKVRVGHQTPVEWLTALLLFFPSSCFKVFSSVWLLMQVYMGLTNVNALMASPWTTASIHIHPGYNNPNDVNYNNDIALIKLQDPITFSASVMPVCLPEAGATYVTGMMG